MNATITLKTLKELETLAEAARPVSEEDYGSDRQVDAENLFWDTLHARMLGDSRVFANAEESLKWATALPFPGDEKYIEFGEVGLGMDFDQWCLHATTDEMLDEALKFLDGHFWKTASADDVVARDCEELEDAEPLMLPVSKKDGPVQKFHIMKRFGSILRGRGGYTTEQVKKMSCARLREALQKVIR